MKKIFCIMLFYFSAYSCDPADPAYMFLDYNDIDRDGMLNLDEWTACEVPPGLKIAPDLCTSEEFKRLDLDRSGKVNINELGNLTFQKINWQEDPCASWLTGSKNVDQNKSR
ncbi:EF-hand domain-containing protein [Campylobacter concisus]|uniref:GDP-mannose dehydrogenase n=1 Tax=Campylobacter concisus TaxID=199 RepID=UPI000CD91174|nr:GDP-mannose dehydrogenase [Campylobacter concisus]